ncbi:MAG TPA: DMT family transporter [Skermanella sp.]|jgi:drug/metabolite transporter (DMT)-like permease|nr:DMT family transporter [Skermanella sp.]
MTPATMSIQVMLLVLLSAFLHASWNAVVKSSSDKFLDIVLVTGGSALLSALVLPFLPVPDPASWPYAAASVVIHVGYFALVGAAYRVGDMSFAYPLMRGTAPVLVTFASGPLIGEYLGLGAWGGVLLISAGVLGMTFAKSRPGSGGRGNAASLALANAAVIALYTIVDGAGVRLSGSAAAYTMWVFLATALPIGAWALLLRRADLVAHCRSRWHFGLIGGACTLGAYVLALWAMTQAPVALVAALRETSILFGTALSAVVLKERFGWHRHAAALAVVSGAVILKLS